MRHAFTLLVLATILVGCSKPTEEDLWYRATQLHKEKEMEPAIEAYQAVLDAYPAGIRAPEALYALGGLEQTSRRNYSKAIEYYRTLVTKYPMHGTSSNASFMVGFIFANELKQYDSARVAYEAFLAAYPTSPMVASAQFELKTLGQSPDEFLAEQARKSKPSAKSQTKR